MENEILLRIIEFIQRKRWKYEFPLDRETTLQNDLRIWGDDAVHFIEEFGKEFNVDVSNFKFHEYFHTEGIDVIGPLIQLFRRRPKKELKKINLGHLEKAVFAGKLDGTIID